MTGPATLSEPNWSQIVLSGSPTLFIGWRRWNKRLEARRISLHEDVHSSLLDLCQESLTNLANMSPVEYGPYVHPEFGEEYFCIGLDELHTKSAGSEAADETEPLTTPEGADLLRLGANLESVDFMDAPEIKNQAFSFYGISWKLGEERYTFIRKSNPKRSLEGGARFFKFAGTLKTVDKPDFVLEDEFDMVVTNSLVAVMRPGSFNTLTADIGFAMKHVSEHVQDLGVAISGKIPLASSSLSAIEELAKRKMTVAKRLINVIGRIKVIDLNPDSVRKSLELHGIPSTLLLDNEDKFSFDSENVEIFLDLVEGRYFEQDFTGTPARADRFRAR